MILFFKILFKDIYHLWRTRYSRTFLRLAFQYGDVGRYKAREVNFLNFEIVVPDCQSFLWQFKEIFADENYRFLSNTSSPLIYNCGANIGIDTLYFKHLYPDAHIKAFEADPTIAGYLSRNIQKNNLQNIEIINQAVWNENTTISFSAEGADGGSVIVGAKTTQVPATRLKDWLEKETMIDLLKMDIEGAEVAVIRDCKNSLGRIRHLFIEYHAYLGEPQALGEILQILTDSGFRYFIRSEADRKQPFVNRTNHKTPVMDLQLNIFAYKD
ncbi:FkbM family methyltransferase [Cytophagaceae bacterium YF14B1]|uniref:FkbM family methyltransferase n=1 Tax=Xanthocytophaga flava TaxID=3048013 RepID=A0AAE3QK90_9BACT|nr:FkbM family methyltransferase [Xanthocytophaga flavus]MDJ1480450.1 FkbM family methyltransferase [Xanthocytophaga flavus]